MTRSRAPAAKPRVGLAEQQHAATIATGWLLGHDPTRLLGSDLGCTLHFAGAATARLGTLVKTAVLRSNFRATPHCSGRSPSRCQVIMIRPDRSRLHKLCCRRSLTSCKVGQKQAVILYLGVDGAARFLLRTRQGCLWRGLLALWRHVFKPCFNRSCWLQGM
jgi:hypothetical protein